MSYMYVVPIRNTCITCTALNITFLIFNICLIRSLYLLRKGTCKNLFTTGMLPA